MVVRYTDVCPDIRFRFLAVIKAVECVVLGFLFFQAQCMYM